MIALVIVGIILMACLLLGQIPLKIGGSYQGENLSAWAKIWFITISLYPKKSGEKKTKSKPQKEPKANKQDKKKMTVPEMLSLVIDLLPTVRTALGRLYGKLVMEEFLLRVTLPGEDDPAQSAILYGQINGLLGAIWNPLVEMFHIQEGSAGVHVDFTNDKMELNARGVLKIKLGQLLWIASAFAIRALGIFLGHRKKNQTN